MSINRVLTRPASRHEMLVDSFFRAIDQSDWGRMAAYVADDVRYQRPGFPELNGLDEFRSFYERIRDVRTGRHDVEAVLATEDRIICIGSFSGESRTGLPLAASFADSYMIENDKIRYRKTYFYAPLM